ncbi:MAG TPA: hypothetical protein VEB66_09275 [Opitutaceae bacterium]|nr:hypothetical protein [Opitutaceae bacterium]
MLEGPNPAGGYASGRADRMFQNVPRAPQCRPRPAPPPHPPHVRAGADVHVGDQILVRRPAVVIEAQVLAAAGRDYVARRAGPERDVMLELHAQAEPREATAIAGEGDGWSIHRDPARAVRSVSFSRRVRRRR